jgi:hypothetical protein
VRHVALVVVLLAAVAANARGHADDPVAALTLGFDRDGAGWVGLTVANPPGGQLDAAAVSRGLINTIPADWANVNRRQLGARWSWFLRPWPAPPEKPAARPLDLKPLLTALRGEGVTRLRLTVMVDRLGNVACNLTARPSAQGAPVFYREDLATDQPPPPLEIRFGERPTVPRPITARAGQWSLALAALALAPLLIAAWHVRRMAASAETKSLGYALWRLFQHGPLATMIAWFVALGLTGGLALTTGWLDGPRVSGWILRWLVLFAVPPSATILLAARVARPAFNRLSADDWVGVEALETAPWSAVLRLVATVLAGSTAVLLFEGHVKLGLSILLVSWTVQLIGDALSERQFGKAVDQSGTELAENVRALGKVLGVRVKSVGIVASATFRTEVYRVPKVVLTPPLIEHFARPAVDALVAQGIARTTTALGSPVTGLLMCASTLFAVVCGLVVLRRGDELPAGVDWVPLTAAASLALLALSFRAMTRAANRLADHRAACFTDPGALVAALTEQERRRGEPPNRSWFEDVFLRCSCADRRSAALARHYQWSSDDLSRLVSTPAGDNSFRYDVPLPAVPERPRRNPFVAPTIVSMVALPLAFAYAAEASPLGVPREVVLAAGVLGVPLLYGAVLWFVNAWVNAQRKRELDRRLRAEGINPAELSGVLVAFAPDREAHNYNGTPQWDVGYLVPAGDRLLFIGRRARVAVPWKAAELSTAPGAFSRQLSRVVVTWDRGASAPQPVDPEFTVRSDSSTPNSTQGTGAFSVWPIGRRLLRGSSRVTAEFLARLQEWRDCEVKADSLPEAWANLPQPPPTPEGAKTVRESMTVRGPVVSVAILGGLVLMAAGSIGLPSRAAWYAFSVVVVTVLAYTLPFLLTRRRRPPTQ